MDLAAVLSACVALLFLLALMVCVGSIYMYIKTRKQRDHFAEIHAALTVGKHVALTGGLYGKLTRVGNETCDIETKSGAVIEVSRYAIARVVE
ncbi:MAG: preprotein translocase subunit YajC [Atopobiaceae bacterium]|nr:preprotein translocase subunit YajC [Atopobiaceae bacterium]